MFAPISRWDYGETIMMRANGVNATAKPLDFIDVHVGNRLKARRVELDMTQEELGRALGVTFRQIVEYEEGRNHVGAGDLLKLSFALGVSVSHFFQGLPKDLDDTPPAPSVTADGMPRGLRHSQKRELLDFIRAFSRIRKPRLRRLIVSMVRELADGGKPDRFDA